MKPIPDIIALCDETLKLAELATPGPWKVNFETIVEPLSGYCVAELDPESARRSDSPTIDADGNLIASSRTFTPSAALALKAAEKVEAAFKIIEAAPELNLSNYDHDDVAALNNAVIEAYRLLKDALESISNSFP